MVFEDRGEDILCTSESYLYTVKAEGYHDVFNTLYCIDILLAMKSYDTVLFGKCFWCVYSIFSLLLLHKNEKSMRLKNILNRLQLFYD